MPRWTLRVAEFPADPVIVVVWLPVPTPVVTLLCEYVFPPGPVVDTLR